MIQKIKTSIKSRVDALRADENGMEAAQVILILVIVVVALVPLINMIVSKITQKGNEAVNQMDQTNK